MAAGRNFRAGTPPSPSPRDIRRRQQLEVGRSVEADDNTLRSVELDLTDNVSTLRHSHRRPVGWWRMRTGLWIRFEDMTDTHLQHVAEMLARNGTNEGTLEEVRQEQNRRNNLQNTRNMREQLYTQGFTNNQIELAVMLVNNSRSDVEAAARIYQMITPTRQPLRLSAVEQRISQAAAELTSERRDALRTVLSAVNERQLQMAAEHAQSEMMRIQREQIQAREARRRAMEQQETSWIGTPSPQQVQNIEIPLLTPVPKRTRRIKV